MSKQDIDQRFVAKIEVDAETGCWTWTAARSADGYGQFKAEGRTVRAHRWSFTRYMGEIPAATPELDHLCCNRACCNPDHLEPVTREENMRRMWATNPRMAAKIAASRIGRIRRVKTHTAAGMAA